MVGKVLNSLLNGSLVGKKVKEVYVYADRDLHIIAEDEDGLTHDIYFNLNNPTGGVNVIVTDGDKVISAWYYGDSVIYIGPKWEWYWS